MWPRSFGGFVQGWRWATGVLASLAVLGAAPSSSAQAPTSSPPPPAVPTAPIAAPIGNPVAAASLDGLRIRVFIDPSGEMKAVRVPLPAAHGRILQALAREGDEHCVNDPETPDTARCRSVEKDLSGAEWDVAQIRFSARDQSPCRQALEWFRTVILPQIDQGPPIFAIAFGGPNVTRFPEDCQALAADLRTILESRTAGFAWIQIVGIVPAPLQALASELGGRFHAITLAEVQSEAEWSRGWNIDNWSWDRENLKLSALLPGTRQLHPMYATVTSRGWRPLRIEGTARSTSTSVQGMSLRVEAVGGGPGNWWLPPKGVNRIDAAVMVELEEAALTRPRPKDNIAVQVAVRAVGLGTLTNETPGGRSQSFPVLQVRTDTVTLQSKRSVETGPEELDGEVPLKLRVCQMAVAPAEEIEGKLGRAVRWSHQVKVVGSRLSMTPVLAALKKAVNLRSQSTNKGIEHGIDIGRFSKEGIQDDLAASVEVLDANGWVQANPPCKRLLPPVSAGYPWLPWAVGGVAGLAVLGAAASWLKRRGK